VIWRLNNIWPLEPSSPMSNLRCLPTCDPFGRPILIIKAIPLDKDSDTKSLKHFIIKAFEQLRIYLKVLYDGTKDVREPTLQYVTLLDLRQLSLQSIVRNSYVKAFFHSNVTIQNVELFTWVLREVIPMFPGMIAGGELLILAPFHHSISSISICSVYSELFLASLRNMEHFQVHSSVAFHEET
jgi:hypothetical protein